jgi:hypothetical protein
MFSICPLGDIHLHDSNGWCAAGYTTTGKSEVMASKADVNRQETSGLSA